MKSACTVQRPGLSRSSLGVSLIEALVALAVMAIGLLGVAGMQASLRSSADLSKQRSEAVRLAQEKVESLRAFGALVAPSGSTDHDYTRIVTTTTPEIVTSTATVGYANTEFRRSVTVNGPSAGASQPLMKTVNVKVAWYDRLGSTAADERSVELTTAIAQIAPELGVSLGVPADASGTQRPGGRHISIPRGAVDQGGGTSTFTPPGGGGVVWTFTNSSGRLVYPGGPLSVLLTGYIRFATGTQANGSESENPVDLAQAVGVQVVLTSPTSLTVSCYTSTPGAGDTYVVYYCAVPIVAAVGAPGTYTWSGKSELLSLPLASSLADATASRYKVCRYTPDASSDTPLEGNVAHPLNYASVGQSLANQNFLVISAGDGTTAFTCPTDDTTTPLVDGDTRRHQPLT